VWSSKKPCGGTFTCLTPETNYLDRDLELRVPCHPFL
jgi:hypothetical protein